MSQTAKQLAREYEVGTTSLDFFQYIVDSMTNGQRQQVKSLFSEMDNDDKQEFLIDFLDPKIGIHKSTLNTCIIELTH